MYYIHAYTYIYTHMCLFKSHLPEHRGLEGTLRHSYYCVMSDYV